jgi:DNA-binding NtrC family response regulator
MPNTLLLVEDEDTLRESLKRLFERDGYKVDAVDSGEDGLRLASESNYDIIISDIILPGMDGLEMLSRINEDQPGQTFIVTTAYASLDTAVRALRVGAYDYVMKPIIHEEIKRVVRNAIRQKHLERENTILRRQVESAYDFGRIIGSEGSLSSVFNEVAQVADSRSCVLLLGETGTGKELFARLMHSRSSRAAMPFVPINCSAIPETLLESELFGHVKGAFTGATGNKAGLFDEANGGTVFLDEIGDMSQSVQVKLLRVIEDRQIRPIGSTKTMSVDLRFIAATNRDLREAVADGAFREDLYYRINAITLELPPLRERKDDLVELLSYYLEKYSREYAKGSRSFSKEALSELCAYRWPGNVREVQNVVERAILISESSEIMTAHLPESIRSAEGFVDNSMKKQMSIEDYTRSFILSHQGSMGEKDLAGKLGITRKTLWEKRKKWGIKRN